MAALRLDVAARPGARAARHPLPRRAAGRDVQRELHRHPRPHPAQEHRLCRRARGAARPRHRRGPHAARRELRPEEDPARCQPDGRGSRLRVREGALRLPAAHPPRTDGQDTRQHPDRRQHRRGPRVRVRGRDGRRVVSDHPRDVGDGGVQGVLPPVPPRRGEREEQLLHPAGRRRTRRGGDGDRRVVGRRARVHADVGARHLADERVHRPRVLRRGAGGHLRHPAHGAVDGHAHAHAAGRPHALRLRVARRHAAHLPVSGRSARSVRDGRRLVRSRRALPDARLRALGSRHRHERLDGADADLGRRVSPRSREGAERRGTRARDAVPSLPRRGWRRHRRPHAAGHAPEGRVLHARIGAQQAGRLHRRQPRVPGSDRSHRSQDPRRGQRRARPVRADDGGRPDGDHQHRRVPCRRDGGRRPPGARRHRDRLPARARLPVRRRGPRVPRCPRPPLHRRAEPRRAVAQPPDDRDRRAGRQAHLGARLQRDAAERARGGRRRDAWPGRTGCGPYDARRAGGSNP